MRKRGLVETDHPHLGGRTQTKKDNPTNHPEHKKHGLETLGPVLARSVWNGNGNGGWGWGIMVLGRTGELLAYGLLLSWGFLYSRLGVGTRNPAPCFFAAVGCLYTPYTFFSLLHSTQSLYFSFLFARLAKKTWLITLLAGYGSAIGIWGGSCLGCDCIGTWEESAGRLRISFGEGEEGSELVWSCRTETHQARLAGFVIVVLLVMGLLLFSSIPMDGTRGDGGGSGRACVLAFLISREPMRTVEKWWGGLGAFCSVSLGLLFSSLP